MKRNLSFDPMSVANSSGFPLQICIAEIANTSPKWQVYSEEHPWSSDYRQSDGFIDLILLDRRYDMQTLVIECKRVRQAVWVFLIPNPSPRPRSHARLWVSNQSYPRWDHFGWSDFQVDPSCHESKYCAIPGQDHGRRNLLERTASELIDSLEAFAFQEKEMKDKNENPKTGFSRIYAPVIITTAELQIACFAPNSVSLNDGTLPDNAAFSSVPYVRFRKTLSSKIDTPKHLSLPAAYGATERTVFIVNSENVAQFLNEWAVKR